MKYACYKMLVGKPNGRKQRGRYRRRWQDDIKINNIHNWKIKINLCGPATGCCEIGH
jgi:hypothetical protein